MIEALYIKKKICANPDDGVLLIYICYSYLGLKFWSIKTVPQINMDLLTQARLENEVLQCTAKTAGPAQQPTGGGSGGHASPWKGLIVLWNGRKCI